MSPLFASSRPSMTLALSVYIPMEGRVSTRLALSLWSYSLANALVLLFNMYFPATSLFALLIPAARALPAVNPLTSTYTVVELGIETDTTSNTAGIFHDGGGGATQNGYHVQVFADSFTTSSGFNFVHNSVAYYGYVCVF